MQRARAGAARAASLLLCAALASAAVPASAAPASGSGSLPRQFVVEVAPGGQLFADGTRVAAVAEVGRWAQRAATGARFAGAVVFGDPERDGPAIAEVVAALERSGFAEVRSVARPAPPVISAARAGAAAPMVSSGQPPARAVAPPRPAARAPARPRVAEPPVVRATLSHLGMHVDGLLNTEPHRGRLLKTFEKQFGTFKRCYGRAEKDPLDASFGVDLLIPKDGGRGTLRDSRTRLKSEAFRTCMRSAFQAIRFEPPASGRPEVVSYSVLFKPLAR